MQLDELKGLGPKKANALAEKGIETAEDLLRIFPVDYEDRTRVSKIGELVVGEPALVLAQVIKVQKGWGFGRKQVLRVRVADETGALDLVYFNGGFLYNAFRDGAYYYCYGKPSLNRGQLQLIHPTFSPADDESALGIKPIYRPIKGVSQKDRIHFVEQILDSRYFTDVLAQEYLPAEFIEKYQLLSKEEAMRAVHLPDSMAQVEGANRRFLYENMLLLQLGLQIMRDEQQQGIAFPKEQDTEAFVASLPFALTGAQRRTLDEVLRDMETPVPMNRLIQGDVGSGKTVVAQVALFKAAKAGFQGAYMMPTEILARQQFAELQALFEPWGISVGLLVRGMPASERKQVQDDLATGKLSVVVGTHTLFQKGVDYANLGLVITDEQHRFGVRQRSAIAEKGRSPDIIVMSATPIPRTLAMILFGDMDISLIDEMPAGRKPIKTKTVTTNARDRVYDFVLGELGKGHQVYVVSPLIDDSETLENLRSATELYEELTARFPDYRVGLLHGEMSAEEKASVMNEFAAGNIHLLVATVVIEVGINVANATTMIIENAERFGLSQMHQLRGRVGRGDEQSYCVLITDDAGETAMARAKTMTESSDGFYIAEKDLELRGPGEMFGDRQHGVPSTQLMGLMNHMDLYRDLEGDAAAILKKHPGLLDDASELLRDEVERVFGRDVRPTL